MQPQGGSRECRLGFTLASFALVLFFISDFAFKLLEKFGYGLVPIPLLVRAGFEFIFIAYSVYFITAIRLRVLLFILFFLVCFIVSRFGIFVDGGFSEVVSSVLLFNKYIFVFIIAVTFYKLKLCDKELYKLRNLIAGLFVFNAIISIVGFVFNLTPLATYPTDSDRFGYNGVFWSANESGYFSILSLLFFYWHVFFDDNKNASGYGRLLLILAAAILNGTKASFLAVIFVSLYFLVFEKNKKGLISWPVVVATYIGGGVIFYNLYVGGFFSYFEWMYDNFDLLTMLMSSRNLYVEPFFVDYMANNWGVINYLFGSHDSGSNVTELEFLDMTLNFGFLGLVIYLTTYYVLVARNVPASRFKYFAIGLLLTASFFSGHYFDSAINAMYVYLFFLILSSPVFKTPK